MQPAAVYDRSGMLVSSKGARTGEDGFVNSEKFWRKKIEDVPVDQARPTIPKMINADVLDVLPQILLWQACAKGGCIEKEKEGRCFFRRGGRGRSRG